MILILTSIFLAILLMAIGIFIIIILVKWPEFAGLIVLTALMALFIWTRLKG